MVLLFSDSVEVYWKLSKRRIKSTQRKWVTCLADNNCKKKRSNFIQSLSTKAPFRQDVITARFKTPTRWRWSIKHLLVVKHTDSKNNMRFSGRKQLSKTDVTFTVAIFLFIAVIQSERGIRIWKLIIGSRVKNSLYIMYTCVFMFTAFTKELLVKYSIFHKVAARKCFVCDSSGLIFRHSSYIPECHQEYQASDTVYYNITIKELTPYEDGNGFCAKGTIGKQLD